MLQKISVLYKKERYDSNENGFGQFTFENVPINLGVNTVRAVGDSSEETIMWTSNKSSDTSLKSDKLEIDNDLHTIVAYVNIPADNLASLIESDYCATFAAFSSDGVISLVTGSLAPNDIIRVTAEDGITVQDYVIRESNLAYGKPITDTNATGDIQPLDQFKASHAVDGKTDLYWSCVNDAYPCNITVDLGNVYNLTSAELDMTMTDNRYYSYQILTSTDGDNFTVAVDKTDNTQNTVITDTFDFVKARYVRVLFLGCSIAGKLGTMRELKVYGYSLRI